MSQRAHSLAFERPCLWEESESAIVGDESKAPAEALNLVETLPSLVRLSLACVICCCVFCLCLPMLQKRAGSARKKSKRCDNPLLSYLLFSILLFHGLLDMQMYLLPTPKCRPDWSCSWRVVYICAHCCGLCVETRCRPVNAGTAASAAVTRPDSLHRVLTFGAFSGRVHRSSSDSRILDKAMSYVIGILVHPNVGA